MTLSLTPDPLVHRGVPVVGSVVSSEADIFVSGDFNGTLIVDAGVQVKIYIEGNVRMGTNGLQNGNNAAANVMIPGVPGAVTTPTISLDTTGGVIASIYAPDHKVVLNGNGGFSGAITAAQLTPCSRVLAALEVHRF